MEKIKNEEKYYSLSQDDENEKNTLMILIILLY